MPADDTLETRLAMDLAAIPDLSHAAVRDILTCPWDVFRALSRHAQRIEAALQTRLHAYGLEEHQDETA